MSDYKLCANGHYYQGDQCPYCPKDYASVTEVDTMADQAVANQMMTIPKCKHCGQPLRKGISRPPRGIVVSSLHDIRDHIVPWNYKWDGKCENCGYDYNISMQINTGSTGHDNHYKYTTVRCASYEALHHVTANAGECVATGFSGVVIETGFDRGEREKVFLSAKEIKYLMDTLRNSPILEQLDYMSCDHEKVRYYT